MSGSSTGDLHPIYNAPMLGTHKALHTEPRAARFGEINVVRRGPVNGDVVGRNLF